ncbi:MAG: hypothetical protein RL173_1225 [Fibrobacterota bacterium]|jgi:hypothetical protein
MTFNEIAKQYLEAFDKGEVPPNGMAKFDELQKLSLDGSMESLARLDAFLLELHVAGYADEIDLDDEEAQNLLYFAAFYLGKVAGVQTALVPNWVTWEVVMEANPALKDKIPEVFGTSVLCVLGQSLYIPLSAVMGRIYEGNFSEESMTQSVTGIVAAVKG